MASRAAAAARLAELRELRKKGKTRMSTYEVDDEEQLYDEVDEEGYKKVVRSRLDRDDFVVDDNGAGYADDGREDWHADRRQYSETESEDDGRAPRGKAAKRKREEETLKQEKTNHNIKGYFNKSATMAAPKPKPVATAEDAAFMADLLGEVDVNVPNRTVPRKKTVKSESRRKTRVISPLVDVDRRAAKSSAADDVMMETPPAETSQDQDDFPSYADDDLPTSDPIIPSSPLVQSVDKKTKDVVESELLDEDDSMEVAQAVGGARGVSASVNIDGSKPIVKPKKVDYPTPVSSSPTRAPEPTVDASTWNQVTDKLNVLQSAPVDPVTSSLGKIQPQSALEDDGSLQFFWMDYVEIKGSLCLFGKVKDKTTGEFVSCFVKIDNILRKLYFLPREHRHVNGRATSEEISMADVYNEVDGLMSKLGVSVHKIKPCSRKYAFELPNIPKEADYLKLLYPYDKNMLATDQTGATFSHVFGAKTALFEQFVLWKGIMGPCWLKIDGADFTKVNNASWCKLEVQVDRPHDITVLPQSEKLDAPLLSLMSLSIRTTFNAKLNKQEILVASARVYDGVSMKDTTPAEKLPCRTFTVMRPNGESYPMGFKMEAEKHKGTIRLEKTEAGLLSWFMAIFQKVDPDVLIGHRLDDVDYCVLLNRLRERKTPGWHRIGRLRRSEWPANFGAGGGNFFAERKLAAGRLLCDLANDMGKSLMTKCQSWSLNEMCELVLGPTSMRREIDNENALRTWATTREGLMNYVRHCEADTYFIAAISMKLQMLPLTRILTNLAGNSWARTLSGTRAERNEYILLHEFHRNKYICPDKVWGKGKQQADDKDGDDATENKKDKFKGGLVFEPEKGLYDKYILVMDFNSLYPSIIQEYNICFTTVDRNENMGEDDKVPEVPEADQEQGILPRLIKTLVSRRREVKKLMKSPSATKDELATWDIKQMALKLTANSMYGCLGYSKSRFYARPLAMLTTFKGREILQSTKELAESTSLRVIYGDTDSVMINTNAETFKDALRMGNEFKQSVNERYRLLEIDVDNVFRRLLLHAKKKYAAINVVEVDGKAIEKLEVKGLDMRRREYCALSKETSSSLLNFLLSGEDTEVVVEKVHDYLRDLAKKMHEAAIPVPKYTIYTQLGKHPKQYPNGKGMPSVQVALRLLAEGKHVKAKDVMSFIITGDNGGSAEKAAENARTLEEVLKPGSGLKPDVDYYLHKQILPPVERLCAPVSGTNVSLLAECLGLDTSKYRISSASGSTTDQHEIQPLESQIPDSIRFKDATPLVVRCPSCAENFSYRGLAPTPNDTGDTKMVVTNSGFTCPQETCKAVLPNLVVVAQLEAQIRQHLARYYAGWLVCDDAACGQRTRQMSVYGHRCLGPRGLAHGCLGKMTYEVSEKALYNQLLFFQGLFDVEKAKEKAKEVLLKTKAAGAGATEQQKQIVERAERVAVLAEVNRVRLTTLGDVVQGYLKKNGRQWVAMDSLFSFALRAM